MRGQVGYWSREGVTIGFDREMHAWLDGRCAVAAVGSGRRVTVTPGDRAGKGYVRLTHKPNTNSLDWYLQPTDENPTRCDLVRFGLSWCDFQYGDGDTIFTALPDDHELAWPLLRECADYDASAIAEEVLVARMCSLIGGGQKSFRPEHRPPDSFRRLLTTAKWAECAATARALSGMS